MKKKLKAKIKALAAQVAALDDRTARLVNEVALLKRFIRATPEEQKALLETWDAQDKALRAIHKTMEDTLLFGAQSTTLEPVFQGFPAPKGFTHDTGTVHVGPEVVALTSGPLAEGMTIHYPGHPLDGATITRASD